MSSEHATKPLQRTGHVATSYKNGMFVWGGYRETDRSTRYLPGNELWFYDTLLEKWTLRRTTGQVPSGTSGAIAMTLGDSLFLFGGFLDNHNTNQLYRLDLASGSWELVDARGHLPTPCDKMAGWTFADRLYVFGGFGVAPRNGATRPADFHYVLDMQAPWRGWTNQFVEFDVPSRTWNWPSYEGKAPVARAAHAAAQIESVVYLFGGRHQQSRLNDIHRLDLQAMKWSGPLETVGEKPCGRSWHSFTAVSSDHIVLFGGFSQTEEPLADCWLFAVGPLTWIHVELPLPPRLWHSACLSREGEVIIFGGCAGNIFQMGNVHAEDTVIVLSFTPRSLYRLCLDKVLECKGQLQCQWRTLPSTVLETLCLKEGNLHGTGLDGS